LVFGGTGESDSEEMIFFFEGLTLLSSWRALGLRFFLPFWVFSLDWLAEELPFRGFFPFADLKDSSDWLGRLLWFLEGAFLDCFLGVGDDWLAEELLFRGFFPFADLKDSSDWLGRLLWFLEGTFLDCFLGVGDDSDDWLCWWELPFLEGTLLDGFLCEGVVVNEYGFVAEDDCSSSLWLFFLPFLVLGEGEVGNCFVVEDDCSSSLWLFFLPFLEGGIVFDWFLRTGEDSEDSDWLLLLLVLGEVENFFVVEDDSSSFFLFFRLSWNI